MTMFLLSSALILPLYPHLFGVFWMALILQDNFIMLQYVRLSIGVGLFSKYRLESLIIYLFMNYPICFKLMLILQAWNQW